jgi:hypothetical protein
MEIGGFSPPTSQTIFDKFRGPKTDENRQKQMKLWILENHALRVQKLACDHVDSRNHGITESNLHRVAVSDSEIPELGKLGGNRQLENHQKY